MCGCVGVCVRARCVCVCGGGGGVCVCVWWWWWWGAREYTPRAPRRRGVPQAFVDTCAGAADAPRVVHPLALHAHAHAHALTRTLARSRLRLRCWPCTLLAFTFTPPLLVVHAACRARSCLSRLPFALTRTFRARLLAFTLALACIACLVAGAPDARADLHARAHHAGDGGQKKERGGIFFGWGYVP